MIKEQPGNAARGEVEVVIQHGPLGCLPSALAATGPRLESQQVWRARWRLAASKALATDVNARLQVRVACGLACGLACGMLLCGMLLCAERWTPGLTTGSRGSKR